MGWSSLPVLERARCTGCGDCIAVCPAGVLALVGGRLEFANPDSCDYCGDCEAACAEGAICCPYDIVLEGNGQGRASRRHPQLPRRLNRDEAQT